MRNLLVLMVLSFSVHIGADEINIGGRVFETTNKIDELDCEGFKLRTITTSIDPNVKENDLPFEALLGHKTKSHVISQYVIFVGDALSIKIPPIESLISNYSRIDPKRPYLASPEFCHGNKVYISLWSGGTCSTVCEAWIVVDFDKSGAVTNAVGLTFAQFRSAKSN
ncbi:hypothetical protein [Microbulbifer sp. SSSA005]|uniref:hypothetical protein n=1 Tax=Microbulbifer sp. SSSA005 TaxID=3243378 RepID=UPI004039F060